MRHLKTFEEKVTDEYYNKMTSLDDKNSEEFLNAAQKQFEIDDLFDKYKYKFIIAQTKDKKFILAKCISAFLNHFHLEIYVNEYGKYRKYTDNIKFQDIDILDSFDDFNSAKTAYENIDKYNL